MLTYILQWLVVIILILGLYSTNSYASLEDGWKALAKNQLVEAQKAFTEALSSSEKETALRGLVLCALAQGESPETAQILSRVISEYPESHYLPAYLSIGNTADLQGWPLSERATILETALSKNPKSPYRQYLSYDLGRMRDMLLDSHCREAFAAGGTLIDHWNVVGPFGAYGSPDYYTPFGPETGIRTTYNGWKKAVAIHRIDPVDQSGLVEFEGLMVPTLGIAYALNVIDSRSEGEALLTIHSPSDFRVWWDGKPVLENSRNQLDTTRSLTVKVPLRKGKILLVIKSFRNDAWWLRVQLHSGSDGNLDFSTIPFRASDFTDTYLHPFGDYFAYSNEASGVGSEYPFPLPAVKVPEERAGNILLEAVWHTERSEFDAAKSLLQEAMKLSPDWAILYSLYGDVSLRHAGARSGSRARFHKEAEASFTQALKLDPHSKKALVGLQSYYLDRDQADQALEFLQRQTDQYPDLLTEGYSGLIHYAFGALYSKKGFSPESIREFEESCKKFAPSYEVYRQIFDYYENNHYLKKAADTIAQALKLFPAYLPFLERAARIENLPSAQNSISLLNRAMKIHPHGLHFGMAMGRALEQQGNIEKTRAWYRDLHTLFPEHTAPLERYGALSLLTANSVEAVSSYQAIFDPYPRRMEPFRVLRDVAGKSDFAYQKYDVQLKDLPLKRADRWKNSRASCIFLLDLMVLDLHEDGTYDQYVHQAIKVLNQEGVQKWAEIVIPKGGNVEIMMARTIAPDQTVWEVSNVQDLSNQQSLSMYGVEEGAIVEYAYLERSGQEDPGSNVYSGGYFFGSENESMLLSKLTIVRPESAPFNLENHPNHFAPKISRAGNRIVYSWENWDQEGIKPESFAPPLSERVPALQWTTSPDWLTFIERLRFSLLGYEETSPEVKRLAATLKQGTSTNIEYVQKVYDWVREKVENTSGGETSADTVILQAGGRYQKLRLARHLLRLGAVESHLALALENDKHDGFPPMPNIAFPATTVLLVPKQKEIESQLILDFGSRFAPLKEVNPRLRKMVALVYDAPIPYFEPVENDLWEHGLLQRFAKLTLQEDHSAAVAGNYRYGDLFDLQIREALTNPEVKKRLADSQIAADLRGIALEHWDLEDVDDITKTPQLVFSGTLPEVAKPSENLNYRILPILIKSLASGLVSEPTREFPIRFNSSPVRFPLQLRYDMSVYLKKGATVTLPSNVFLLTQYGYYSLFYTWDGADVVVNRSFLIPDQEIRPDQYPKFVDFCRTIDQVEDREIQIKLPVSRG